jgi:hypothetical protein
MGLKRCEYCVSENDFESLCVCLMWYDVVLGCKVGMSSSPAFDCCRIRAGIATAACALSVQQKITLHSLITCFNLSALFRDGFRYGNNMSLVDMILYSFM